MVARDRSRCAKIPKAPSVLEETFAIQISQEGLPTPVREFQFDETRGWLVDYAWPDYRLLVELEGYSHRTAARFLSDQEKYDAAAERGWTLLRFSRPQIMDWSAVGFVREALAHRRPRGER